ncbi:MAG: hypothetical protein KAI72_10060, partial [Candidatus Pacebacteria bacterium]|nr:hypothetical protein [Candidatus Paceibacterota bacterium]
IADTNWRDVLSLVPLAIWNDSGTIKKYPALIFHNEATSFDADSSIHFMQMYEPSHLTTIGSIPSNLNNLFTAAEPTGAGISEVDIANIQPADYFSYWSSYNSLVIVDYDNYKAGLMASVFASHKNSPIIFVNSANLATYQAMINGKTIYTIGNLDGVTQSYINNNAGCEINYSLEEVQKWYSTETNSDKLILVNPGDLEMELNATFFPEKSFYINNLFSKMSLSAPFLAAAKQEVIAFTELADPGSNSGCSVNATLSANIATADADALYVIQNLFSIQPNYLTVIAWPRAIPESEYDYCNGLWQVRNSVDWKYGSTDNIDFSLNVGRIYGITVADASANIVSSIFYDTLINNLYGGSYTGTVIALTGYDAEDKAEIVKQKTSNSGYDSICIVEDGFDNSDCSDSSVYPYPFPDNLFQSKRFVLFEDHGLSYSWPSVFSHYIIPWFDLSYNMADACLTNSYWDGEESTISINMIRKGAIAYYGATGITFGNITMGLTDFYKIIKELTGT